MVKLSMLQGPGFNPHHCKKEKKLRLIMKHKNYKLCGALVAHACNPSHLGGRDKEDHGSKPAGANSS
jgi:hypothetical protein